MLASESKTKLDGLIRALATVGLCLLIVSMIGVVALPIDFAVRDVVLVVAGGTLALSLAGWVATRLYVLAVHLVRSHRTSSLQR